MNILKQQIESDINELLAESQRRGLKDAQLKAITGKPITVGEGQLWWLETLVWCGTECVLSHKRYCILKGLLDEISDYAVKYMEQVGTVGTEIKVMLEEGA